MIGTRTGSRLAALLLTCSPLISSCGLEHRLESEEVETITSALTADSRNVWTSHNDNNRTGATLGETVLTTSNVNPSAFGRLFERTVDDQIYAQPLWLANVTIAGSTSNVVYVATVAGTVYAFDADNPSRSAPLVSRNLIPSGALPITNKVVGPQPPHGEYHDFSGKISLVGTPVIDVAAGTMFLVVRYISSGNFVQRLHALNVTNLADRSGSPVVITASVPGNGDGSQGGQVAFNAQTQSQRPGLALAGGTVYISWASHGDLGPYHGWIIAYDATSLARVWTWNSTPNGGLGGIWQSGQAPTIDSSGRLYLMTGNGTSTARSGGNDYGNSVLKLNRTLSNPVVDWFTPFNVDELNGLDLDLGSSGVLLLPDGSNRIIGGGKEGRLYVLNTSNLGHHNPAGDTQIVQSIPEAGAGNIHGSPVYYHSPTVGKLIYLWPEYDHLKAFSYNGSSLDPTPLSQSPMRAPDGMPGAMLSLSANGSVAGSAVLWANLPYVGDANQAVQPGILRAFDANDVSREIWNSRMDTPRDDFGLFAKYAPPTVANGKVYQATFSNKLVVYGLRSQGLRADYFDNSDLTGQKISRIDPGVNNDWGNSSPDPSIGPETFSVRWSGLVQPQFSQTYTFYTLSNDGVRLWVNGVQLVNNWTNHNTTENSGTISLTANQKYTIVMEYFDNTGTAVAKLSWSSSSRPKQIIPASRLFPRTLDWDYRTDGEGWTPTRLTTSASGGKLLLTITGANPQLTSPDNLNATAAFYQTVRVRLHNQTPDDTAQIYWTTVSSTGFDETKKVNFPINPSDDRVREYVISMAGRPGWTGRIKRLRLDPVMTASSGTVRLDALRLSSYAGFADGRHYRLIARHSDQVVDVADGDPGDGVNIWQWSWNGTDAQLWEFVTLGEGYYYVVPKVSRKCMDVAFGEPIDGANIWQYACNSTYAQHFRWIGVTGDYFRIENRIAGKVLDVQDGGIGDGVNIQQWTWLGGFNQQFRIVGVE